MSAWFAIACLGAFTVGWPFLDVSVRNRRKRRARGQHQVRITDA
jgi:hypothetical protein